ncbi:MAG: hypothetical protein ROO76_21905 [Terriglobia bacterium]|jgi:hypothetical protein|nr:hypothetical protein [Terriglobia bacterium]
MATGTHIEYVRAFVRNLNVVVKQVNLYGLAHRQVAPQLENTWKELRGALCGERLVLTAAGDHLLLDGKPLQAGSADRTLSQMLVGAGIAGICFFPEIEAEQLTTLVRILATTKLPDLVTEFKKQLGDKSAVRLLEFRVSGEEPAEPELGFTGAIAAAMLSGISPRSGLAITGPVSASDLLRMLCSLGDTSAQATPSTATSGRLAEGDVTETIRWLVRLSAGQKRKDDTPLPAPQELPTAGLQALREAIESANTIKASGDRPALLSLAEQLAVNVALEKYHSGEIPINAVHEMLQRLKKEIEALHKVLRSHEDTMQRAGLLVESEPDALDRQFWAGIPDRNKLQVLLSPEAWCVPARNIGSFATDLSQKNDVAAEQILRHYCLSLKSSDPEARLRVAHGIATLAPTFALAGLRVTRWAMAEVSGSLSRELASELTAPLCTALAALVREAAKAQRYEIVPAFFDTLGELQRCAPQISDRVHIEAGIEGSAERFVEEALSTEAPPRALVEALQQMPYAVATELKKRAAGCAKRSEYRKLTSLADRVGEQVLEALRHSAGTDQASEALPAIGLLTPLDCHYVERTMKKRLSSWTPLQQATAIHQIACSGMMERGILLSQLFDSFDELVLPQAIDEIGFSGRANMDRLMLEAGREDPRSEFVQLKVIEALGNLREKSAVALLKEIVLAKSVWKFEFPRETRIVALQALLKIESQVATDVMKHSSISMPELLLAPLKPASGEWVRQRRYTRVPLDGEMRAEIISDTGTCDVSVEALSLGGGGGTANDRAHLGSDGQVEFKLGLRKVRARVLLHGFDSHKVGFEIASIPLEDRTRLRQFLTSRQHR